MHPAPLHPDFIFVLLQVPTTESVEEAARALLRHLDTYPFGQVQVLVPHRSVQYDRAASLTGAEQGLAHMLGEGLTNKEIASRLKRSPDTVSSRLKRLYKKIEVKNRAEAVAYSIRSKTYPYGSNLP